MILWEVRGRATVRGANDFVGKTVYMMTDDGVRFPDVRYAVHAGYDREYGDGRLEDYELESVVRVAYLPGVFLDDGREVGAQIGNLINKAIHDRGPHIAEAA